MSTTTRSNPAARLWHHLRTTDFAALDAERTIALLPVAACEQHGPHLPLATDALIAQGVVEHLLALPASTPGSAHVLVLPLLPIGDSLEHSNFAGTLSASLESLLGLWLDVGSGVAASGVRKLVIFNTHGGQRAHVDLAAVRLRARHGMLVARASSGNLGKPDGLFDAVERAHGLHGGAIETSMMLYLRPDLVDTSESARFDSAARPMAERGQLLGMERGVGLGWMAEDLNPAGVCGDATTATASAGKRMVDHLATALRRVCDELAAQPLPPLPAPFAANSPDPR